MEYPANMEKSLDLRHYGAILWRRKGLLILSTVSVISAAIVALQFMPDEYESRVTLLYPESQGLTQEFEQYSGQSGTSGRSYDFEDTRRARIGTHIRSPGFLERVARRLRMTDDAAIRAAIAAYRMKHPGQSAEDFGMLLVVRRLQSSIQLATAGPGIYEIVVWDYDPEMAKLKAQTIGDVFLDDMRQLAYDRLQSARDFSVEKLKAEQERLRVAEAALNSMEKARIADDLSGSVVRAENLRTAEGLLRKVKTSWEDAGNEMGGSARALRETRLDVRDAEPLLKDPGVRSLVQRLRDVLKDGIDDRLTRTASSDAGEAWPPGEPYQGLRVELNKRLESLALQHDSKATEEQVKALAGYAFFSLDAEIQDAAATDLQTRINSFLRRASSQPEEELKRQELEKEVQGIQAMIGVLEEQVKRSAMGQALEAASLGAQPVISDNARLPLSPSRPNRLKILLAALLLGPVLGVGFGFLSETTDATLRSLEDIQRVVPEPILCTTPLLSKLKPRQRGLRRHWVPAAVAGVLVLTAGFFLARFTVLAPHIGVGRPIQAVPPDSTLSQAQPGR